VGVGAGVDFGGTPGDFSDRGSAKGARPAGGPAGDVQSFRLSPSLP